MFKEMNTGKNDNLELFHRSNLIMASVMLLILACISVGLYVAFGPTT
jgi:hypothetical protein